MARVHARSWRATYSGLLPDAMIDDVVEGEPTRVVRWRTWLSDPGLPGGSFVAEQDGSVVGFIFWGPSEETDAGSHTGEIHAIYVDPDVIGRGIGRALLQAAVDALAAHGFTAAVLWVLDTNGRARRFYEAAGWRSDGSAKIEHRPAGSLNEVRYRRLLRPRSEGPT